MADFVVALLRYGEERWLSPDEVLLRQGSVSDGLYYLKTGQLGVYREERDAAYRLSSVVPGDLVGEIGSTTGWARTATVKAEEESLVIHVSGDDFHRALNESPALAEAIVRQIGERLTDADGERISLGRSYHQALERAEKLSSEKERLEELLRLREELGDMIVHDLRNPLCIISNGLELVQHAPVAGGDPAYVASALDMMGRSVRRMQRLVDTLLDIARMEEGAMALCISTVDLAALVRGVVAEEGALARRKDITLEEQLPEADRDVLQRVLANLLDNAVKFTPSDGHVWMRLRTLDENGGAHIEVVDTGPGIPAEERERIFEKFTQVPGQGGSKRGVGLGLAFCRMAVEAHGGCLWVENRAEGEGSCFMMTLPRGHM